MHITGYVLLLIVDGWGEGGVGGGWSASIGVLMNIFGFVTQSVS